MKVKTARSDKIVLAAILVAAAILRFWGYPSYFPAFWDEAKYLDEVEGIIPYFSVNAGAFAILKLAHAVADRPYYAQFATALFGLFTVFGCYLLGRRILEGRRGAETLGLLMAGQAALMPYYLSYSRHALAAGFALCFFVFALYFYLARLQPPGKGRPQSGRRRLTEQILSVVLLALVPACSSNLFLPTVIWFIAAELIVWYAARRPGRTLRPDWELIGAFMWGASAFLIVPAVVATISGYAGWWTRMLDLFGFHTKVSTMRAAFHFLYPIHVYYLAGLPVAIAAVAGILLLPFRSKAHTIPAARLHTDLLLGTSFIVYLVFFGCFSHLQAARLYALTLPFLAYAAARGVLGARALPGRFGPPAFWAVCVLLGASLVWKSGDYLSKTSQVRGASDEIVRQLKPNQMIHANAKDQIAYGINTSPAYSNVFHGVTSLLTLRELKINPDVPPIVVIQDGVNLVSLIATYDKWNVFPPIDDLRDRLRVLRLFADLPDRMYAAAEDFYTSPYYYLEDVYSRRCYSYIRTLMPEARDSIFVCVFHPADTARFRPGP